MRERTRELKAAARRGSPIDKAEAEREVLEKIATFPGSERALGERIHRLIMANAPHLTPRLWYGMPAYANEEGVLCHFQNASKFKMRYSTLGFSDNAKLDDGQMWPVAYALRELTAADEAQISALVRRAVG